MKSYFGDNAIIIYDFQFQFNSETPIIKNVSYGRYVIYVDKM